MPNYFYGPQAEQFAFYRIPKALFTNPAYRSISTDAKVLYGLLLDRMSLSARNDWLDDASRVYIIFTVEEVMDALCCADNKATRLLREMLELLVDTVCSKRRFIRIAGDDKPAEVVKAQLMKLNGDHLRFVLMCLKENNTQVRNIRQYLLATLYNAPMTMHSSYAARVQHDMNPCS